MAQTVNDSNLKLLLNQGDQAADQNRFMEAYNAYKNASDEALRLYGYLQPELLPVLAKLVAATLRANDQDYVLKQIVKALRSMLVITERIHGLDAPELIPVLTQLVQFYDYDGAHMLAIEVKQRIDDIVERQAALKS